MVDIDFFKKVNDQYGHDIGDIALKQVTSIIKSHIPDAQIIARFGGEEFCIFIQELSPDDAQHCFDTLRLAIEEKPVPLKNGSFNLSVSIGLCTEKQPSIDAMITIADTQLYQAKQQGRNRICTDHHINNQS